MSETVDIETTLVELDSLEAPRVFEGMLQDIESKNPGLAKWIRELEAIPIIKECAENALTRLNQVKGIRATSTISDNSNSRTKVGQLMGALATNKLPHGLGIQIAEAGTIKFIVYDDQLGHQAEIERLRQLFSDAFLAEVTNSILVILGYEVNVVATVNNDGELFFNLEGVKQ